MGRHSQLDVTSVHQVQDLCPEIARSQALGHRHRHGTKQQEEKQMLRIRHQNKATTNTRLANLSPSINLTVLGALDYFRTHKCRSYSYQSAP